MLVERHLGPPAANAAGGTDRGGRWAAAGLILLLAAYAGMARAQLLTPQERAVAHLTEVRWVDIHAKTPQQAFRSLEERMRLEIGLPAGGRAFPSFSLTPLLREDEAGCVLVEPGVQTKSRLVMSRVTLEAGHPLQGALTESDRVGVAHERMHGEITRMAGIVLDRRARGLGRYESCAALRRALDRLRIEVEQQHGSIQERYDFITNHGESEGVATRSLLRTGRGEVPQPTLARFTWHLDSCDRRPRAHVMLDGRTHLARLHTEIGDMLVSGSGPASSTSAGTLSLGGYSRHYAYAHYPRGFTVRPGCRTTPPTLILGPRQVAGSLLRFHSGTKALMQIDSVIREQLDVGEVPIGIDRGGTPLIVLAVGDEVRLAYLATGFPGELRAREGDLPGRPLVHLSVGTVRDQSADLEYTDDRGLLSGGMLALGMGLVSRCAMTFDLLNRRMQASQCGDGSTRALDVH